MSQVDLHYININIATLPLFTASLRAGSPPPPSLSASALSLESSTPSSSFSSRSLNPGIRFESLNHKFPMAIEYDPFPQPVRFQRVRGPNRLGRRRRRWRHLRARLRGRLRAGSCRRRWQGPRCLALLAPRGLHLQGWMVQLKSTFYLLLVYLFCLTLTAMNEGRVGA